MMEIYCDRWMFLYQGPQAISDTTNVLKKQLALHKWKVRRTKLSQGGSRYVFAARGKDRLLVRVSNHKSNKNVKRIAKIAFGRKPDFSFHPGCTITVEWILDKIRTPAETLGN